ncbi:MAG: dephospho-CoA kinase [Hydrogenophaga sp.]|jgi:dephospho-CoA kinase|nr:dephospho-CoA kinase [Hydrogenophaga sp.]
MGHTSAIRLGLTGGIGSGKSTVGAWLRERGATLIDADAISRATTQAGGAAMPAIAQHFGAEFVTAEGALNRQRMRDHVFAHPPARQVLEAIVHPLVGTEIQRQALASTSRCLVFDVPLLVESAHWRHQLDRVLVVDCSVNTQLRRVSARNGWDPETTQAVIQAQSPRTRRLAAADWVIFNDGDKLEHLQHLVKQLADRLGL